MFGDWKHTCVACMYVFVMLHVDGAIFSIYRLCYNYMTWKGMQKLICTCKCTVFTFTKLSTLL